MDLEEFEDDARERALDPEQRLQHARDLAYRYLGKRDRSVLEVRRHLERRDVDPETIEVAIGELEEQRYLDDARYAQRFAEDRRRLDHWGAERIAERLRAVGIPADHIEAAIAAQDRDGELDVALALLERRFSAPLPDDRARERAFGVLVRRGYDLELAHDAIRAFERRAAA
jgi:regulatory protein